jgi:Bacterial aa3 type cytochrome c oxidase subunit IV
VSKDPLARSLRFAIVRRSTEERFSAMTEHDSHYTPGSMDISQHQRGYAAFLTGVKWTLILVLGIVAFLAIFRTHN